MAFAPGHYTVTYDPPPTGGPTSLGETEGPKRWQMTPYGEQIRQDSHGRQVVDVIDQGQDWFIQMILKEWNSDITAALYPFGTTYGTPLTGQVAGRLYSAMAGALVLTPVTGSAALTLGPGAAGTISIPLAIVVPDQQIEVLLGNVQRDVPVTFMCLPDANGVSFTET